MLGETFGHRLIRRYVAVFGTLFNDIWVNRTDPSGEVVQTIRVPISYAPKEKMLLRVTQDPLIDRPSAVNLPRMSFELRSATYVPQDKLPTTGRFVAVDPDDPDRMRVVYNPVSYDFAFTLYVYANRREEASDIVEQILPFFTPSWTVTAELVPDLGIVRDLPVTLVGTSIDDTFEGQPEERRAIVWTLDFVLRGFLFGPVKRPKVIKSAIIDMFVPDGDLEDAVGVADPSVRATVRPALLANGSPTTNADASVPLSQISSDDDYGISVVIEDIVVEGGSGDEQ